MKNLTPDQLRNVQGGAAPAGGARVLVGPEHALQWLAQRGLPLPRP